MNILTKRQKEILDYIDSFRSQYGYSPSYKEIAEHFRLRSKSTVHQHIFALKNKGFLHAEEKKSRSVRIKEHVKKFSEMMKKSVQLETDDPVLEIPMLGSIAAGEPIEAVEDKEMIGVPPVFVSKKGNTYALRVRGDSMVDDGIFDGDYVIVERNFYPNNGDVVVALLNNENVTLKRYFREKKRVRLQPANVHMRPIYAKNPAIQGIVRGLMRRY